MQHLFYSGSCDHYVFFIYRDSLEQPHRFVSNVKYLCYRVEKHNNISDSAARRVLANRLATDSVLSFKEFGLIKPIGEIRDQAYMDMFYSMGRDSFLRKCTYGYDLETGGRLKIGYDDHSQYFPSLVAAAYKMGIRVTLCEEKYIVSYISKCQL